MAVPCQIFPFAPPLKYTSNYTFETFANRSLYEKPVHKGYNTKGNDARPNDSTV